MARPHPRDDARSDDELFAVAREEVWLDDDAYEAATDARGTLRWRATREIFDRAVALARSTDPRERSVGIDVASTLRDIEHWRDDLPPGDQRWHQHRFAGEAAAVLLPLVRPDEHPQVLISLAWAFENTEGFGRQGYAPLLTLVGHPDEDVRYTVAHALPSCARYVEDDDAPADEVLAVAAHNEPIVAALMVLAGDEDGDVRDWAIFGVAGFELDVPEVRQLYVDHLDDPHEDAREEAIYGLAALRDERALEPLIGLLRDVDDEGVPGNAAVRAAEAFADPRLLPALRPLLGDEDVHQPGLEAAIAACEAG